MRFGPTACVSQASFKHNLLQRPPVGLIRFGAEGRSNSGACTLSVGVRVRAGVLAGPLRGCVSLSVSVSVCVSVCVCVCGCGCVWAHVCMCMDSWVCICVHCLACRCAYLHVCRLLVGVCVCV